jgi:hypothetical protein
MAMAIPGLPVQIYKKTELIAALPTWTAAGWYVGQVAEPDEMLDYSIVFRGAPREEPL